MHSSDFRIVAGINLWSYFSKRETYDDIFALYSYEEDVIHWRSMSLRRVVVPGRGPHR